MLKHLATILGCGVLLVLAPLPRACTAPRAEEAPPAAKAPDPAQVKAALDRVEKASAELRRRATLDLIALGPGALAETRRARDGASDSQVRAELERAARWQLAAELRPVLAESSKTGLSFDGQFSDLKAQGPDAVGALLALLDDEETLHGIRVSAAHALADVADKAILGDLRRMEADPLFPALLGEEVGTLMAILGDTRKVDRKVQDLSTKLEKKSLKRDEKYRAYMELSNVYYRIRQYQKAVQCYDGAIRILEGERSRGGGAEFNQNMALVYYNAACSLSLNKEVDRARAMIKKAVQLDPMHLKNLDRDGDLKNLREAPGYAEFKRELEKPLEKKSI